MQSEGQWQMRSLQGYWNYLARFNIADSFTLFGLRSGLIHIRSQLSLAWNA